MHIAVKPAFLLFLGCTAGIALSACAPVGRSVQQIGTAIHQESATIDRKVRDMFDAEGDGDDLPKPVEQAYCYRTWGEISCYRQPLAGAEHRLVGKQEAPPQFADYAYPYPEHKPVPPTATPTVTATNEPIVVDPPLPVHISEAEGSTAPIAATPTEAINESVVVDPPLPVHVSEAEGSTTPIAAVPTEAIDAGGVVYEVPEYAIRERNDIPDYKKPRELIPFGGQ